MTNQRESILAVIHITFSTVGVILFGLVNSKIIAVYGGKESIALLGLYQSVLNILTLLLSFGISRSIVVLCSEDSVSNDLFISSARTSLLWITGIGVFIIGWAFDQYLFQGLNHIVLLVATSFFILNTLELAIVQYKRDYATISKVAITSALINTILSLVMFSFYKEVGWFVLFGPSASFFYLRWVVNAEYKGARVSWNYLMRALKVGFPLMLSGIIASASLLLIRIILLQKFSLGDLGIYQAAYAVAIGYFGVIVNSLSTEYYPRLAQAVNQDPFKRVVGILITDQLKLSCIIAIPILASVILMRNELVIILYSKEFLRMSWLLAMFSLGDLFKVFLYPIGMLFAASKQSQYSLLVEVIVGSILVGVTYFCTFFDIAMFGYIYLFSMVVAFIVGVVLLELKYSIRVSKEILKLLVISIAALLIVLLFSEAASLPLRMLFLGLIGIPSFLTLSKKLKHG